MIIKKIDQNIEFLRGVAVIFVFLFHFDTKIFNAFFVGVDIFFVISGYVITKSIFSKKDFNIFNYFLKRIKRIYPNLIFVLLVFFLIYNFLYKNYTNDYSINFFSTIFSFLGLSNIYYSLDPKLFYFNEKIRWLIHTWSLSVEIQYYFIYGVLSFLSIYFYKKKFLNIKFFQIIFILLFLISFFLFIFTEIKFISDYYSLVGRLWQFMLGSLLFFYKKKKNKLNFFYVFIIFTTILILFNILSINYELIICFSSFTIFLIIFISKELKLNNFSGVFSYFGKISYSFYLWHLIFLSLFRDYFNNGLIYFISVFFVTTCVSHFSYRFVEFNFNNSSTIDFVLQKFIKISFFISLIIVPYILIFNYSSIVKTFNYLNQISISFFQYVDKKRLIIDKDKSRIVEERYDNCSKNYENFSWSTKVNCLKDNSDENLVFLFGNSYGEHLIPALYGLSNINLTHSRFENYYLEKSFEQNKKLEILLNQYKNIAKNYKRKIILISLNTNMDYSKSNINYLINKIKDDKTKIVLIYPHPDVESFKNNNKLENYIKNKKQNINFLKENTSILIYDSFEYLCKNCEIDEYSKLFIDNGHYNLEGSMRLFKSLNVLIKSIL